MYTPFITLLILSVDPALQLFPVQHLLKKLKDHLVCEVGHDGVSSLVASHVSPWAPHLLKKTVFVTSPAEHVSFPL